MTMATKKEWDVLWMEEIAFPPRAQDKSDEVLTLDIFVRNVVGRQDNVVAGTVGSATAEIEDIFMMSKSESSVTEIPFESETISGSISIMITYFDEAELASWSPSFGLDMPDDDRFSMLPPSAAYSKSAMKMAQLPLARINCTISGGTQFIEISDGSLQPPYVLENRGSDHTIFWFPKSKPKRVSLLRPGNSLRFAGMTSKTVEFCVLGSYSEKIKGMIVAAKEVAPLLL